MDKRQQKLTKLKEYIEDVDKEVTLLLQNLQWDHKNLLESPAMVTCKYVSEHRIPLHSVEAHEKLCYVTQEGYCKEDVLLPDPVNPTADTIVKLSKQDIMTVINTAASMDPSFKRGPLTQGAGSGAVEPLSAERLQQAYTADERRAIHDAVVAAVPACHDPTDLALGSSSSDPQHNKVKSHAEILVELRDMKRRRARYRVAAKTAKYSDVLRDVIKTQMELYAEAKGIFIKTEYGAKNYVSLNKPIEGEINLNNIVIKQERISPEPGSYYEDSRIRSEKCRSPDKRKQRNEHEDRRTASKRSREHYVDNTSHKRKYKDYSQDKYEKRRYYDGYSKQETYQRTQDTTEDRDRHDSTRKKQASTSTHRGNSEKERLHKYVERNYHDTKKSSKYESSFKEYDKYRNHKEDHSKYDKYDDRKKYEEYKRSHKEPNRYREERPRYSYCDVKVKEEKDGYYEDSYEERMKHRH